MSFPPNPSTGGGGGSFVINDDHFFADNTARDAYFVLHPDELETGTLIYVNPGYQQYNGSSWVDVTAVVTGPQGDPGKDADNVWGTLTGTLNDQTDLKNALDAKIPTSQKGAASGVAELNSSGIVPTVQLPGYVDDVVEYADAAALPATGESGKIYFTLDDGKQFRWGGTTYVEIITGGVALGETSDTAYRGDRGKTAYDHSQIAHAPSNAEANVQSDWNQANTEADDYIKNKPIIPSEYSLPTATDSVLGGVKIGSGITITDGVISAESGGASAFVDLSDTPSAYTGQAGKSVVVNSLEDGLEFGEGGEGSTVKVTTNDTTSGYLSSKLVAGSGVNITVQNAGGNETLELSAPVAVYNEGDTDVTLPESPVKGQIYEYIGIGTIWSITANTGQQVRYLSETGDTITAEHGYACCMLVYLDDIDKTWLVKNVTGSIDITEA